MTPSLAACCDWAPVVRSHFTWSYYINDRLKLREKHQATSMQPVNEHKAVTQGIFTSIGCPMSPILIQAVALLELHRNSKQEMLSRPHHL